VTPKRCTRRRRGRAGENPHAVHAYTMWVMRRSLISCAIALQVRVRSLAVTPQREKANEDHVAKPGCGTQQRGANMKDYSI